MGGGAAHKKCHHCRIGVLTSSQVRLLPIEVQEAKDPCSLPASRVVYINKQHCRSKLAHSIVPALKINLIGCPSLTCLHISSLVTVVSILSSSIDLTALGKAPYRLTVVLAWPLPPAGSQAFSSAALSFACQFLLSLSQALFPCVLHPFPSKCGQDWEQHFGQSGGRSLPPSCAEDWETGMGPPGT